MQIWCALQHSMLLKTRIAGGCTPAIRELKGENDEQTIVNPLVRPG